MFSDIKEDSTFRRLFPVNNFVIQKTDHHPDYLTHLYWLVHYCLKKCQENCFWKKFVAEEGKDPTGKEDETNSKQNAKFSFQRDLHIVRICNCFGLTGQVGTGIFYAFLLLLQSAYGRTLWVAHGQHNHTLYWHKGRLRTWSLGEACRDCCCFSCMLPFQIPPPSLFLLDLLHGLVQKGKRKELFNWQVLWNGRERLKHVSKLCLHRQHEARAIFLCFIHALFSVSFTSSTMDERPDRICPISS